MSAKSIENHGYAYHSNVPCSTYNTTYVSFIIPMSTKDKKLVEIGVVGLVYEFGGICRFCGLVQKGAMVTFVL